MPIKEGWYKDKHVPDEKWKKAEQAAFILLDPELENEKNRGITAAIEFVDKLKASVLKPAPYVGKQNKAEAMDKFLHEGWSEHDALKRAFEAAVKIINDVTRGMTTGDKKNYSTVIHFLDQDGKEIMRIETLFDEDGEQSGGISASY